MAGPSFCHNTLVTILTVIGLQCWFHLGKGPSQGHISISPKPKTLLARDPTLY